MRVINLLGGPGCGKSTTAAGLFHLMKTKNQKVELVREYVKDMAYEERDIFDDQLYIFGKQQRRQHILQGRVDWIITDSPLILSAVYAPENYFPSFSKLCIEAYNCYDNINIVLERVKEYQQYGRNQTEEEARAIDKRVRDIIDNEIKGPWWEVAGNDCAHEIIWNNVIQQMIVPIIERKSKL